MKNSDSSLAKNTIWAAVASLSATASRMLTGVLLAHIFSTTTNGNFLLFLWFSEFFTLLVCLGAPAALTRFLPLVKNKSVDFTASNIISWSIKRSSAAFIIVAPVMYLIILHVPEIRDFNLISHALLFFLLASQSLASIGAASLIGQQLFKAYASNNVISGMLGLILQASGAFFYGINGALFGLSISNFIVFCLAIRTMKPDVRLAEKNSEDFLDVKKYALQTGFAVIISSVVWSRSEIFFLNSLSSATQAAYFGVSIALVSAINIGVLMLTGALTPHFSSKMTSGVFGKKVKRDFSLLTKLTALFSIPVSIYFSALMPFILPLFFGVKYSLAVPTAQILILSGVLSFANVGSSLQYASGNSSFVLKTSMLGAFLMVIGLFIVVPHYGSLGAAFIRLLLQGAMIFIGTSFNIRKLGMKFPGRSLLVLLSASFILSLPLSHFIGVPVLLFAYFAFSIPLLFLVMRFANFLDRSETVRVKRMIDRNVNNEKINKVLSSFLVGI